MKIGIYLDGFSTVRQGIEVCQAAEVAGCDSFWLAQHMGYRDALTFAGALAVSTKKASIVPTAITPYLWPSWPVAMSIATLDELAPGRAKIAVSVGNVLNLRECGVEPEAPVPVLREYAKALRAFWRGETLHLEGRREKMHGANLQFGVGANIPVYVASTGPKVLTMAGAVADGVLLSGGMTLVNCRQCLDHAEEGARKAGRDPGELRKAGFINFNVSRDGTAAKRALLRKLAYLFRSEKHAANIQSSGLDIDHKGIIEAMARRDLDGATSLLPLEAANIFGVAGTPDECAERMESYLKVGMSEPIIEVSGSGEEQKLALNGLRDLSSRQ